MEFRDLECFNVALLGKHGWGLITSPHSLCSRVLKGLYFPMTEFMHATVPLNASATWRPIVAGRATLEVGLLKRIGNGSSINI